MSFFFLQKKKKKTLFNLFKIFILFYFNTHLYLLNF